jgi:hypothetical protein
MRKSVQESSGAIRNSAEMAEDTVPLLVVSRFKVREEHHRLWPRCDSRHAESNGFIDYQCTAPASSEE